MYLWFFFKSFTFKLEAVDKLIQVSYITMRERERERERDYCEVIHFLHRKFLRDLTVKINTIINRFFNR